MTNHHERIYALLVEANPVEDPEKAREIIDRRRLTLVKPRRHEMTDVHEATDPEAAPKRPRWMVPLAAAAAVILFIGVIAVASNGSESDQEAATSVPPTTTTAASTTTTAAPTTTTVTTELVVATPQVWEARVAANADGCSFEGPETMNVGDTVEITVTNDTDQYVILDIYRFKGDGSPADLPDLAATPELAYDRVYSFGSAEVWMLTLPNTEGGTLHHDFDSTEPSDKPFELKYDRSYGFICWSAPGPVADITAGFAAADGFMVVG